MFKLVGWVFLSVQPHDMGESIVPGTRDRVVYEGGATGFKDICFWTQKRQPAKFSFSIDFASHVLCCRFSGCPR